MAHRDRRQAFVFGLTEDQYGSFTERLDGRSTRRVMALIHRRKPSDISGRVLQGRLASKGKATHGPLAACESAGLTVLRNQSGDLLPGVCADLDEGANHDPLMRP